MSGIDNLKRLNEHLGALLADPQPGLFTWNTALSETLVQMSDYAGIGRMSAFPKMLEALKAAQHMLNPPHQPEAYAQWAAYNGAHGRQLIDSAITNAEGPR